MEKLIGKVVRFFERFEFAVLNVDENKLWTVDGKLESIPYLKHMNAEGSHILMRPAKDLEPFFLLVDDIHHQKIGSDHRRDGIWKPGRMCVETSPNNYQVWIHSDRPLSLAEKRYWLNKLGSDPGADPNRRWGRCPGFRNRKPKYRDEKGGYPLAKLVWVDWRKRATIPATNLAHLDACEQGRPAATNSPKPKQCEICRDDYDRGDESATDFSYALALLRRGFSLDEIYERILAERENWQNHRGGRRQDNYLRRTIDRAYRLVS